MTKNAYFVKIINGEIVYQGFFEKITQDSIDGYFFEWATGTKSTDFNAVSSFLDDCILFNSDYEMRLFTENVKNGKIDLDFELSKNVKAH